MATWYSDHFTAEDASSTTATAANPRYKVPAGLARARLYYAHAFINLSPVTAGDIASDDTVRFMTIKSADRIVECRLSWTNGAAAALTANFGFWESGIEHDGAEVDATRLASAVDLTADPEHLDIFTENSIKFRDAGIPAWDHIPANVSDPQQDWDIVMEFATVTTPTNYGRGIVELWYTSHLGA